MYKKILHGLGFSIECWYCGQKHNYMFKSFKYFLYTCKGCGRILDLKRFEIWFRSHKKVVGLWREISNKINSGGESDYENNKK